MEGRESGECGYFNSVVREGLTEKVFSGDRMEVRGHCKQTHVEALRGEQACLGGTAKRLGCLGWRGWADRKEGGGKIINDLKD